MMCDAVVSPRSMNARAMGASIFTSCQCTMPVKIPATAIYKTVQISSDAIIPIGKSRCGFFASCAVVETASNPIYAKNMYAAPTLIPLKPIGAKLCQSLPQFATDTYREPNPMTNSTTETLITTIVELNRALSLMPTTRIAVMTSAMTKAGKLKPISVPKIRGAFISSCARCNKSGDCVAMIELTLSRNACVPGTSVESELIAICRATSFSAVDSAVQ